MRISRHGDYWSFQCNLLNKDRWLAAEFSTSVILYSYALQLQYKDPKISCAVCHPFYIGSEKAQGGICWEFGEGLMGNDNTQSQVKSDRTEGSQSFLGSLSDAESFWSLSRGCIPWGRREPCDAFIHTVISHQSHLLEWQIADGRLSAGESGSTRWCQGCKVE